MFTLITQVDRTKGNYESAFIYTLNAGFSGISGNIENVEIRMFIPEYLNIFYGDIEDHVEEIRTEEVEGGRNIIFDFGSIEDLGVAVRLGFGMSFIPDTPSGTLFELKTEMYINGIKEVEYINEQIELEIITRFEISREVVLPSIDPAPGGEVFYKLTLQNFEDLGGEIQNIQIICQGTANIQIDSTFPVVGSDVSSKFADTRYDNVLGSFVGNTVEFNLEAYKGQKYEFIYKGIIGADLEIGTEIVTLANWSIDTEEQEQDVHTITLGDPVYTAVIPAYGPNYTLQNEYIGYEFNIKNTGNQPLQTVSIEEILPQEIEYYEFKTGTFHFAEIKVDVNAEYVIQYTTVQGNVGEFGPFNTNTNSTVDLQFILDEGDNLATLRWDLVQLSVGMGNKISPKIDGIVKSDILDNTTIINEFELSYVLDEDIEIIPNTKSTIVQNTCVLNTSFSQTLTDRPINPNTVIRYSIGATCRESRLLDPIIAFMLPKELEYIGNDEISYTDYFPNSETPELPDVEIIPDINENGDTIIKFAFENDKSFNFRQKSNFNISFDTRVKTAATGEFETFMILNTITATEVIPDSSDIYRDTNDIAENPLVSPIYAKSNVNENRILFFVSTKSNKKIKGNLDTEFLEEPQVANATSGGSIEYKISVTNIGNVGLEQVEIVDILPHIGDTGVILNTVPRNSGYPVYTITEVTAKIIRENGTEEKTGFEIFYSNSYNPVRFGPVFNEIGVDDDWILTLPENIADVKSFKVITNESVLNPNDMLEINVIAVAPVSTPVDSIAWNSFAADVVYKNLEGDDTHLLAIEPEKVGVQIQDTPVDKGVINGYVWFDDNKNGLPDIGEEGMNDVGIVLEDENGIIKDFTFTNPNFDNENGYYSFNNLDYGNYVLTFFKDPKFIFTKQRLDEEQGSKVNSKNNKTAVISINEDNRIIQVNGGLIKKPRIEMEKLLEVNTSANQTIKNIIRNQMLITMKMEDTKGLIEKLENS